MVFFYISNEYRCGRHGNARKSQWYSFILAMEYRCGRHDNARTSQGYSFTLAMGYRCGRHGMQGHRNGILLY